MSTASRTGCGPGWRDARTKGGRSVHIPARRHMSAGAIPRSPAMTVKIDRPGEPGEYDASMQAFLHLDLG